MKSHVGSTLIELMVAMALSLGVVAAVMSLLSSTVQTARFAQDIGATNTNGAMAMAVVGEAVKMAGYGEILGSDFVRTGQTLHVEPHMRGCRGQSFLAADAAVPDLGCMGSVGANDSLFVSYQGDSVLAASQGQLRDCTRAGPVAVTQAGVGAGANRAVPLIRSAFSVVGGRLMCGGNGRTPEPILDNVLEFRVFFGLDSLALGAAAIAETSLAPVPRTFVTAATVESMRATSPADPWDMVIAVLVCVTIRTEEAGLTTGGPSERCPATEAEAQSAGAQSGNPRDDGALTRSFVEVFNVRSRAAATTFIGFEVGP